MIAHRLATETDYTFIVVEAGSKSHALLEAPVLGPFFHGSILDWQYETVPQKHACFAMKNNVSLFLLLIETVISETILFISVGLHRYLKLGFCEETKYLVT